MRTRRHSAFPLATVIALLATACTSGATSQPSAQPTTASTSSPTATPTAAPTELPGTKEFTFALSAPGLGQATQFAALDAMRAEGYDIEVAVIDASELVAQGVASGEFQFGSTATNTAISGVENGGNIKVVVSYVNNEWSVYARNNITECAGLDGVRLAIHSEGSVSAAMVRNYIAENCPDIQPNYVIIAGSPARFAALMADQIDATPVELAEAVAIEEQASDRFHRLASFATDLPDLQATTVFTNGDWAEENPGTVLAYVKAQLVAARAVANDPDALLEMAKEQVADYVDAESMEAAVRTYSDLDMYPVNGGITEDNLTYTMRFFGPDGAGIISRNLPLEEWSDLSYLEAALDELGMAEVD